MLIIKVFNFVYIISNILIFNSIEIFLLSKMIRNVRNFIIILVGNDFLLVVLIVVYFNIIVIYN